MTQGNKEPIKGWVETEITARFSLIVEDATQAAYVIDYESRTATRIVFIRGRPFVEGGSLPQRVWEFLDRTYPD